MPQLGGPGSRMPILPRGTPRGSRAPGNPGDLNAYAAPAIRLTIANPAAAGDNVGTLICEPYWQISPVGTTVPTDDWIAVAITSTQGLFWWDGGLGHPTS